jgi:hypothetical protein
VPVIARGGRGRGRGGSSRVLSSDWGDLNDHLKARFYLSDSAGKVDYSCIVVAPLSSFDGPEITLSWTNPFENSGIEASASNASNLMQTGAAGALFDQLTENLANEVKESLLRKLNIEASIDQFKGRTGITKLNSTQAFQGMPPIKLTMTAEFRAMSDPKKEVQEPIAQLVQWALPRKLEATSTVVTRTLQKGMDLAAVLMPSLAPQEVAFVYKGLRYAPMVIESISLSDPSITRDGLPAAQSVTMVLCTLTALDQNDWLKMTRRF